MLMLINFFLFHIKKNFLIKFRQFVKSFLKKWKLYEYEKKTTLNSKILKKTNFKINKLKKNKIKLFFYKIYINSSNKKIILSSFFRKNKIYIKSKFSKARAFTKNIVYLGLIINIILIVELNLFYYNITINYGYFITPIYIMVLIVSSKIIYKYNLIFNFIKNTKKYMSTLLF